MTIMASIVAPAGLTRGLKYRIVFVTDGLTESISADHSFYDKIVQAEAAAAGLDKNPEPVTWLALISSRDGTKATDRLPVDDVPIYLLSAKQVTTGKSSIWTAGALLNPINQSPTRTGIIGNVWTGTRTGGDCVANPLGGVYHQENAANEIASFQSFVTQPNETMRLIAFSQVFSFA
jgi:hypothetical protein